MPSYNSGTVEYAGLTLEWEADETYEDGFTWNFTAITQDGGAGFLDLQELAKLIESDYAAIDECVRKAFIEARDEWNTDLEIAAYEDAQSWREAS